MFHASCALVNCVLCDEAVVEDGCELKDCLVGSHHTVPSGGKYKVFSDV